MLAGEPWLMSRAEIGRLPDWYIQRVIQHPREENGNIKVSPKGNRIDVGSWEYFRRWWLSGGLTEFEVEKKWKKVHG